MSQHLDQIERALIAAEGHLEETLTDDRWHPVGHCPTLDVVRAALAAMPEARKELQDAVRDREHTRDWYGSRWHRMDEWFRSPEMKGTKAAHDWFGIVANGQLLEDCPPVTFMASVHQARHQIKRFQNQVAELRTRCAERERADATASALREDGLRLIREGGGQ